MEVRSAFMLSWLSVSSCSHGKAPPWCFISYSRRSKFRGRKWELTLMRGWYDSIWAAYHQGWLKSRWSSSDISPAVTLARIWKCRPYGSVLQLSPAYEQSFIHKFNLHKYMECFDLKTTTNPGRVMQCAYVNVTLKRDKVLQENLRLMARSA